MPLPPPPPTGSPSTPTSSYRSFLSNLSSPRTALTALSARTRTPLPSLLLSFGVLHEITAIVPLVGVFYAARGLGVGERIVSGVLDSPVTATAPATNTDSNADITRTGNTPTTILDDLTYRTRTTLQGWVQEGDKWASRVGRRYGFFGYTKGSQSQVEAADADLQVSSRIAGDVANAVVAYGVTKALLPARIALSIYLSPAFSRGVIEPSRKAFVGLFRR